MHIEYSDLTSQVSYSAPAPLQLQALALESVIVALKSDVARASGKGSQGLRLLHVDTVLLRRLYLLFFIHHGTRQVRIVGVTANLVANWVTPAGPKPLHGTGQGGCEGQVPHPWTGTPTSQPSSKPPSPQRASESSHTPIPAPRSIALAERMRGHTPARVPGPDARARRSPPGTGAL